MKILNKIAIVSLAAVIGLAGCKKSFLDQEPTAQVATDEVFKTVQGAESAVQGIHRMMYEFGGDHNVFGYPSMALMWDLMGEDMPINQQGSGWFVSAYRYTDARTPDNTGSYVWSFFFRMIHNANMILANIDNIPATGAEEGRKAHVKASALFYRAFAYYNLSNCYMFSYAAGNLTLPFPNGTSYSGPASGAPCVPLYTSPTKEGNSRATVNEVYTQITKDLTDAIALLESSSASRSDKSEIDASVAKGLYARVALVMQNWATAETMAHDARQGYQFMTGGQITDGFNDVKNPEWMWGSIINEEQNTIYASFLSQMDIELGGYAVSQQKLILRSLFDNKLDTSLHDARRNWWVGRYERLAFPEKFSKYATYGQRKFRGQSSTSFRGDFPLMRAGEMALIEAEAMAQQNKVAQAADLLNEFIRTRRPGFSAPTNNSKTLIDTLWVQRRIELWGEGFRYFDLKRQMAPFVNANSSPGLDRQGHSTLALVMTLTPGDVRWLFKIPGSETNVNRNMVQNP